MNKRQKNGRFISRYEEGRSSGMIEGREQALEDMMPCLQHIGSCGAVGSDPEDSRCICGLRLIWISR